MPCFCPDESCAWESRQTVRQAWEPWEHSNPFWDWVIALTSKWHLNLTAARNHSEMFLA
jgi:hypothetical protein